MSESFDDATPGGADLVSSDLELLDTTDGVDRVEPTVEAQPQVRKKIAASDDVVLLQIVNAFRPWRAPGGTANDIMEVFDDIAVHCAKQKGFRVQKNGPALRTRFNTLVSQFRIDGCKSLRQSGASETFEERDALLQQIVSQMDDWNERLAAEKKEKSMKAIALERSGAVLKRLAMDELDEDDEDPDESSATDASSTAPTPTKSNFGRRRSKATKTEKLGAVTDALASAIVSTGDDAKHNLELEQQKMTFKREEAENHRQYMREEAALRREYEAREAARRREHELAVEERRIAAEERCILADQQREKMMHDLFFQAIQCDK